MQLRKAKLYAIAQTVKFVMRVLIAEFRFWDIWEIAHCADGPLPEIETLASRRRNIVARFPLADIGRVKSSVPPRVSWPTSAFGTHFSPRGIMNGALRVTPALLQPSTRPQEPK